MKQQKKSNGFLKKHWFKFFGILFFAFLLLLLIGMGDSFSTQIGELDDRVGYLEISEKYDELNLIDPYERGFQDLNNSFNIVIDNIEKYGSGTKLIFRILNKDSVTYKNLELTFKTRNTIYTDAKILEEKEHKITQVIRPGYTRKVELNFPDTKIDELKRLSVEVGASTITYYEH